MALALPELIERWNSNEGKPYKGSLIDWSAYQSDNANIGCMCAQGQALHLLGGWTPEKLRDTNQQAADKATAKLLNISIAHAILLRSVNDSADGAPAIVLTHPEKIIGDQAPTILAFWRHLDRMTAKDWVAAWDAARDAAWDAARAPRGPPRGPPRGSPRRGTPRGPPRGPPRGTPRGTPRGSGGPPRGPPRPMRSRSGHGSQGAARTWPRILLPADVRFC
jgi:hypothetical protein